MKRKPNLKALKISILDNATDNNKKDIKLYAETDLTKIDYLATYNKKNKTLKIFTAEEIQPFRIIFIDYLEQKDLINYLFDFIAYEHEEERKTQDHYKEIADHEQELKEEAKKELSQKAEQEQ
jgi:ABC-type phosphate/phosphonate transport system substrate-binding protein